jgi:hypothetical protein
MAGVSFQCLGTGSHETRASRPALRIDSLIRAEKWSRILTYDEG